ncbi:rhodanese-like domain-containing protein [Algoriphagus namhaensis]
MLLAFSMLTIRVAQAQSFAYQTLLSTLYDQDFPVLQPSQVDQYAELQILDTREREEFEVSHLQDAIWVGYSDFEEANLTSLDKTKPILVYCTVGARSQEIGKKLQDQGFEKVYNLYGGIIHWVNEGLPVYRNDEPTNQVHTYSRTWGIWLKEGEKVYQ